MRIQTAREILGDCCWIKDNFTELTDGPEGYQNILSSLVSPIIVETLNTQLQNTDSQVTNELPLEMKCRAILYYRKPDSSFCDSKYKIKERTMIWLTF